MLLGNFFVVFFSETFQRVLLQIIDQSFTNIYDEFAREMAKPSLSTSQHSSEANLFDEISSKISFIFSSLLATIHLF